MITQGPFEAAELCDAMGDDVECVLTMFGGMTGETGHAAKRCAEMEHPPNQDRYGARKRLFFSFSFHFLSVCPEPVWANHRFSCKTFT